ncbi:MAG TPA: hypothetical protein H9888_06885 [Candidatus Rikenella faecigallinarum]|uniref:Tail specific protease domain-containing protein n=1 Tax=Candidatus Rikenella faecigallinarum TaxID=2838745 RepID=A0A9D1QFE6_9BACT|nr:hypothetical protein [Candidatus Rikenella faecigallinarum]
MPSLNCTFYGGALVLLALLWNAPAIAQETPEPFLTPEQRAEEVDFIVRQIDSVYVYGRRGLSDSAWDARVRYIHRRAADARNLNEYYYALRYMGLLISDAHFEFPNGGYYNRHRLFQPTDTLFPLFTRAWHDGRTYVVRDYSEHLPKNARLLRINGLSVDTMACLLNAIPSGEREARGYGKHNPLSTQWQYSLMNHLFMEGIRAPFRVEYTLPGSTRIDTVTLAGMTRETLHKKYKKLDQPKGDNLWSLFFGSKTFRYKRFDEHSALLTFNSFWGENMLALLLFNRDRNYPRRLKRVMTRIDRHDIDTLVIDISRNGGGMTQNVYQTLNYLTDRPVDANAAYRVTDHNRGKIKTLLENRDDELFGITPEQKTRLIAAVDSIPSGSFLETNNLCNYTYRPDSTLKHRFHGTLYLLTGYGTYSAAQLFAQYFRELGLGKTAGQHCGGYGSISGGNSAQVPLPYSSFHLNIPYATLRNDVHAPRFGFDSVNIPFSDEPTFEEWYNEEKPRDWRNAFIDWLREQRTASNNTLD